MSHEQAPAVPVGDEYIGLLEESGSSITKADVDALQEMYKKDLAARQEAIGGAEPQHYVIVDGTVTTHEVISAIQAGGQQRPGSYDGKCRRA